MPLAALVLVAAVLPQLPSPDPAAAGSWLYRTHCGVCHGSEGRGDGPMADLATVQEPAAR